MRENRSEIASRPGPKPQRLRIEGDAADSIRRIFNVPKPEGGWPKPDKCEAQSSKKKGGE